MAIFHLDFKIVKRSDGMSSVAKAAYHARCEIYDERTGDTYDFSQRTDLYGHIILSPVSAPAHITKSSSALWNEVEKVERQNNGQTARYFDVAIPAELNNDDKKKLVIEYCQKNFVDKGMIADIAFHDLDSDNPHAHVMLTLKTIDHNGFGKKERSWNDKKVMIAWREAWANISNSYLEAAGTAERIDHRSLRSQYAAALTQAEVATSHKDKAFWLAKATEANRPPMRRIHRAKWDRPEAQEQRAAEQAVRDQKREEAQETYMLFKDLPLEIVVDVRSFTVSVLAEPEEIVLPDSAEQSANSENQKPVLVASAPHTRPKIKSYRHTAKASKAMTSDKQKPSLAVPVHHTDTILKTPSPAKTRSAQRAAVKHQLVKPRQNGIFKRFAVLVVDFFKDKLIWARKKPADIDADRNKRIAEKYIFDEVLGIYVSRTEYDKRDKFSSDEIQLRTAFYDDKPTIEDEITRFPSRPVQETVEKNNKLGLTPPIYHLPTLKPRSGRQKRK